MLLRLPRAAGEAASHPDDRNGLGIGPDCGAPGRTLGARRLGFRIEGAEEVFRQARHRRVIEYEGDGKGAAERSGERVAQLDRHQRIEAQVAQRAIDIGRLRPEHPGRRLGDVAAHERRAFAGRHFGQAARKRRRQSRLGRCGGESRDQRAAAPGLVGLREPPVRPPLRLRLADLVGDLLEQRVGEAEEALLERS